MKTRLPWLALTVPLLLAVALIGRGEENKDVKFPRFRVQEIEKGLKVGYAVLLVDVNGDGKKDIVVVDTTRVVWYENPTWKRHTIIEGQTRPDNVCIAAYDIDGDGKIDFALGADWKPFNTKEGGTIQWLKQGKTPDDWTVYPIGEEPTVHRIRFADLDGSGKKQLVVVPLMGRNSTAKNNWMDGEPVRILAYKIPADPTKDRWVPEVIDQSLHVAHNFCTMQSPGDRESELLTASYDGVTLLARVGAGKWQRERLAEGDQANPKSNRGASEIKHGKGRYNHPFIGTVEPWHGNQIVVYTPPRLGSKQWERHVIDDRLKWGHAVWCADVDGDSWDEIIVGVRDDLSMKPGERRGVRLYKALDDKGTQWARHDVDPGGVAVEDLAAADLDGDGKIDIVAVGRQTGNVRIYWNEGIGK